MGLETYSTVAANNNKPPPNGAPEGMNPGAVNDCIRQVMADTRAWYEGAEWINLGTLSGSATIGAPTYVSATSFTIAGNVSSIYHVNRRVKAAGTAPFTIYGTITASAYSSPNTTVTVQWDSGALDASLTTVWFGVVSAQNSSLTAKAFGAATLNGFGATVVLPSNATVDLGTSNTNNVSVSGTTAITSFGSSASASSPVYQVYFQGVLTLTQNATSLILPSGANITTAAGDNLLALYLGSGNWRVLEYNRASGAALVQQTIPTASTTQQGIIQIATAAVTKAATDTTQALVAGTLLNHPGIPKAWVTFTGSTGAILDSFNVSSVTRASAGTYTVNFSITFANANYAVVGTTTQDGNVPVTNVGGTGSGQTTTACPIVVNNGSGGVLDRTKVYIAFFGNI